jgi:hypothetical protein
LDGYTLNDGHQFSKQKEVEKKDPQTRPIALMTTVKKKEIGG